MLRSWAKGRCSKGGSGGATSTPLLAASTPLGRHDDDERRRGNLPDKVLVARTHQRVLVSVRGGDVAGTTALDCGKSPAEVDG
jgi:hypothetical protein